MHTSGLLGEGVGTATSWEAESSAALGTPNSSALAGVSTVGSTTGTSSADRTSGKGVSVASGARAEDMSSPRVGAIGLVGTKLGASAGATSLPWTSVLVVTLVNGDVMVGPVDGMADPVEGAVGRCDGFREKTKKKLGDRPD